MLPARVRQKNENAVGLYKQVTMQMAKYVCGREEGNRM
jgi:hypothetical protein